MLDPLTKIILMVFLRHVHCSGVFATHSPADFQGALVTIEIFKHHQKLFLADAACKVQLSDAFIATGNERETKLCKGQQEGNTNTNTNQHFRDEWTFI